MMVSFVHIAESKQTERLLTHDRIWKEDEEREFAKIVTSNISQWKQVSSNTREKRNEDNKA